MSAALTIERPPYLVWNEGSEISPGLWCDIPNAVYHHGLGISKSGLDDIATAPAYFKVRRENPSPPTAAMLLGTVLHALVLEPETFDQRYVAQPADAPRRPNDRERFAKKPSPETVARCMWWGDFEQQNSGKVIVPNEDGPTIWDRDVWSTVHFMRDAIMRNGDAAIFLEPGSGIAELSAYWVDPTTNRLCRCRPDFWNQHHNLIIDLKSARAATMTGFQRSVHDYRYDVQGAFYTDGMRMAGEMVHGMVFIACEKEPPYLNATYDVDKEWIREGRISYQRDLYVYSQCMESGDWPGLPDHTRVLPQPGYARFKPVS
jgi:hypothetical protein